MKALLLSAYNELTVEELPKPTVGPDELLIEVAACGICGSDVHGYDGSTGRRIPPIVMGHEAAGIVAAVGAGVTSFEVGDRVTFDSTVYCGECAYCRRGEVNLCDQRQVIGVSCGEYRRAGAFAEFLTVPARIAYRLPESFRLRRRRCWRRWRWRCMAVAVSEMQGGETVLVIGAGMIGLLLVQAARAAGCARVFVSDVDATRLELAEQMGADRTLEASGTALIEEILRLTGGRWRGCGAGGGGARGDHRGGHRLRAQGRNGDAGGQHLAADYAAAAEGGFAADTAAGIVRVGW